MIDDEDLEMFGDIDGETGPDLGACCVCEASGPSVRNVLMLGQRSPTPGKGWGCLECGAPSDGAIAVVCDACLDGGRDLRFACVGWPGVDGRVPISALSGAHDHDEARHLEIGT